MVSRVTGVTSALADTLKLPSRLTRGYEQARREHRDVHDSGFGFFVSEDERVLLHVYKIPQITQNAMDFFTIV